MSGLRVVFMGTPEFAVPTLKKIHHSRHPLVGIITQPDRPRGRGQKLSPPPVKQYAIQHNISPVLQPEKLKNPEFLENLRDLKADVFVVVAFRILPEEVFTMPPAGTLNLHPSLLPKYRGAAPINWTIIEGEKITGVTTILIQKEVDAGNILLQKKVPVEPDDTAGTLHDRLAVIGAEVLLQTLDAVEQGQITPGKQDESQVTKAPKITREIAHLNFNQPACRVRNFIHGLSPFPGSFALYRKFLIKFYRAKVISETSVEAPPGTIVKASPDELWIACAPGVIAIEELQMEGRRTLNIREFLRGYPLERGEQFR